MEAGGGTEHLTPQLYVVPSLTTALQGHPSAPQGMTSFPTQGSDSHPSAMTLRPPHPTSEQRRAIMERERSNANKTAHSSEGGLPGVRR